MALIFHSRDLRSKIGQSCECKFLVRATCTRKKLGKREKKEQRQMTLSDPLSRLLSRRMMDPYGDCLNPTDTQTHIHTHTHTHTHTHALSLYLL